MHLAWPLWSDLRVIFNPWQIWFTSQTSNYFCAFLLGGLQSAYLPEIRFTYWCIIFCCTVAAPGHQVPPEALAAHAACVKGLKEMAVLMLMTMDLDIQQNLEHLGAYDMLLELKTLFAQQAEHELLQTVREFHAYKKEEGQSVSSYVLKMKSYIDNLEHLGHLVSLNLALHEQMLPKKDVAHALHVIRVGKVQKKKPKKPHKPAPSFAPKPKNPPPPKKNNPAKDAIYHQCCEVHLKTLQAQAQESIHFGRNYDPMDDEPMWAADHVFAPTPSSAITIPKTANEFAIKDLLTSKMVNLLYLFPVTLNQTQKDTTPKPTDHYNLGAYDMLLELKTLFAQQAEHELLQTVREFHAYKKEEGQSVSSYVLKMKSYIDNLERLGHLVSQT
ncbi:hypothetical protein Tco_1060201 [Tanacetum coccineum]